jgi:hypothetical protein
MVSLPERRREKNDAQQDEYEHDPRYRTVRPYQFLVPVGFLDPLDDIRY